MTIRRWATLTTLLFIGATLDACAPYTLRGRVVQGEISYVAIVDRDDPRLSATPISGVRLDLTIDPARLNRTRLPESVSGALGEVAIPVRKTGAGLLEYEAALLARRPGFMTAEGVFPLPSKKKRVLVMLAAGDDPRGYAPERTIDDDLRDFNR